jgi:hypothetical protein
LPYRRGPGRFALLGASVRRAAKPKTLSIIKSKKGAETRGHEAMTSHRLACSCAAAVIEGYGGKMMTVRNYLFATAFACTAAWTTAASAQALPPQGRPVIAKDISGKKICWDDGHWGLFAANGEFSNDRNPNPHSKWSVPEPGVIKTGSFNRQTEILPDGQFHSHWFKIYTSKDRDIDHWGKVCG